tara:strand:- start:39 stop:269 length:231 start_codon:yes stop_codon:yes gene_type:complete
MKSSEIQLIVVCIIIGFFIYYRKLDYYKVLPRYSISASFFVALWSYISIKQPWFIILGLIVLNILDRFDMLEKLNN